MPEGAACLWYRLKARLRACRRIGKAPDSMARSGFRGIACCGRRSARGMSIEGRYGAGAGCCRTRSRRPCRFHFAMFPRVMSRISIPGSRASLSPPRPGMQIPHRALRPSGNRLSLVERSGGSMTPCSRSPLPASPTDMGEEIVIEPGPGYSASRKARAVSGSRVRAKSGMAARKVWP